MFSMTKEEALELAKSVARYIWFGFLGVVVLGLSTAVASPDVINATITVAGMKISFGFIVIAAVGSLTKAIDIYIHNNKDIETNGIAPSFLQK